MPVIYEGNTLGDLLKNKLGGKLAELAGEKKE